MSEVTKKEARKALSDACAIAHGQGAKMTLPELAMLVVNEGLPRPEEREQILADRLAEGDDTTTA